MELFIYSATEARPAQKMAIESLAHLLQQEEHVLWLDIQGHDAQAIHVMEQVFRFHPLAIEDSYNQRQRPKVEEYPTHLFAILNPINTDATEEGLLFRELDIFIGKNYIVTIHGEDEPCIQEARQRIEEACQQRPISVGYLAYVIIDEVVDDYFPMLDHLGDEIDGFAESVLERPDKALLERLLRLKRMLSEVWRVAAQQRDAFSVLLREDSIYINQAAMRYYLRDIHDHLLLINDTVNTFRDMLNHVFELYMFAASNRLNAYINRLTIITIGIGFLTVIGGFYGMNFSQTWPPFEAEWGVPFVTVLMLLTFAAILWIIRQERLS